MVFAEAVTYNDTATSGVYNTAGYIVHTYIWYKYHSTYHSRISLSMLVLNSRD